MSLRHAANRFRVVYLDCWDGAGWYKKVVRCSFSSASRTLSDDPKSHRLRRILVDPREGLPEQYTAVKVANTQDIYLVCASSSEYDEFNVYSKVVLLRQASYVCELFKANKITAASGFKTVVSKASMGTYPCDKLHSSLTSSEQIPTAKLSYETIFLPAKTPVTASQELHMLGNIYNIEEVHYMDGILQCHCLVYKGES